MSAAFTPGPWGVVRQWPSNSINGAKIMAEESVLVARVPIEADKPLDQKIADAHLLAAAPDLYYATNDLLGYLIPRPATAAAVMTTATPDYAIKKAQAALAKARGEQ